MNRVNPSNLEQGNSVKLSTQLIAHLKDVALFGNSAAKLFDSC